MLLKLLDYVTLIIFQIRMYSFNVFLTLNKWFIYLLLAYILLEDQKQRSLTVQGKVPAAQLSQIQSS